jgi:hypothetical protein
MSGIDKIITDTNKRALMIALLIVFVAWYFCLIIIPIFPNGSCPAGIGTPGSFAGGSSGGSNGGSTAVNCPVFTCPEFTCDEPNYTFDIPYCADGVACPAGNYDTYYGTCRCGTSGFWDASLQLCCPNVVA